MYCLMRGLELVSGHKRAYPVLLEAILIMKVGIVYPVLQTFRTLQGSRCLYTAAGACFYSALFHRFIL